MRACVTVWGSGGDQQRPSEAVEFIGPTDGEPATGDGIYTLQICGLKGIGDIANAFIIIEPLG